LGRWYSPAGMTHLVTNPKVYKGKRFLNRFSLKKRNRLMKKAKDYLAEQSTEELFYNYGNEEIEGCDV